VAPSESNDWARSRAQSEMIAWAMDLSEQERASLVGALPTAGWSHEEQARFAALLVVIADREEIGLSNEGLETYPGPVIPGVPADASPPMTLPEILATPIEELLSELTELTDDVVGLGVASEPEMRRLGVLWMALTILKEPDDED
jgi:hypothetical protein